MSQWCSRILLGLCVIITAASCAASGASVPTTHGRVAEDAVTGVDVSEFADYLAFKGITAEEEAFIQDFIRRCPQNAGARMYFDPLYRGFYQDPSSITPKNASQCQVDANEHPFIVPMALPPFPPKRLVNIYDQLPPVVNDETDEDTVHRAIATIDARSGCAANQIEGAHLDKGAISVRIIMIRHDQYMDRDPALLLNKSDKETIENALELGIPVTISPVSSCAITTHEWKWDGTPQTR